MRSLAYIGGGMLFAYFFSDRFLKLLTRQLGDVVLGATNGKFLFTSITEPFMLKIQITLRRRADPRFTARDDRTVALRLAGPDEDRETAAAMDGAAVDVSLFRRGGGVLHHPADGVQVVCLIYAAQRRHLPVAARRDSDSS